MQQLSMEQKANRNPRCVEPPPSPDSSRAGRLRAGTEGCREHAPSGTGGRVGSVSSRTAGRTPQLGDAPGTPLPTAAQAPGLWSSHRYGSVRHRAAGGSPGPGAQQPPAQRRRGHGTPGSAPWAPTGIQRTTVHRSRSEFSQWQHF